MSTPSYLTVKNIVCTYDLGRSIPSIAVGVQLGARLDSGVFPAATSRCAQTDTTNIIFATGKLVIVGCSSENEGLLAAHWLPLTLWKTLGIDTGVFNFRVCNIVCFVDLPFQLNLDLLFSDCKDDPRTVQPNGKGKGGLSYEPETFPGMSWPVRLPDGTDVTIVLFTSGKGVTTQLRHTHHQADVSAILGELHRYELGKEYRALRAGERHTRTNRLRGKNTRKRKARDDDCDATPVSEDAMIRDLMFANIVPDE